MKYCIDTSSLLASGTVVKKLQKYPRDLFPKLWAKIEAEFNKGNLVSIEQCKAEILRTDDDVSKWIKSLPTTSFKTLNSTEMTEASQIIKKYPQLLKSTSGSDEADPYLVAYCKQNALTLISEERYIIQSQGTKNFKLPNACELEGITCLTLLDYIRSQNWTF